MLPMPMEQSSEDNVESLLDMMRKEKKERDFCSQDS
jgi:hypothetical protein